MVKIYLTPFAKSELREIQKYISLNNPLQAKHVANKIVNEIKKIPLHPTKGRPIIIKTAFTIRQILVYNYKIFYRELNGRFEVVSIYHSTRLLSNNPGLQNFFDQE